MNIRISDYTRQQVESLQARLGLGEELETQTRVIASAIDRMYKEEIEMAKSFDPRDGKFFRPSTRCASGQNVFDASEEKFGKGVHVDLSRNASFFMPNPETATAYGPPIGEVTVRPGESFWVYTPK